MEERTPMQSVILLSFIEGGSILTSLCSQALIEKFGYARLQSDRLYHHTVLDTTIVHFNTNSPLYVLDLATHGYNSNVFGKWLANDKPTVLLVNDNLMNLSTSEASNSN